VRYIQAENLESEEFKRLCGISLNIFNQIIKVVATEKILAKKATQF
jgi:hypothetical protein